MPFPWITTTLFVLGASVTLLSSGAHAQAQPQVPAAAASPSPDSPLFAVEIKVGPKWDVAKPPQEQAYFREHSANLRALRDQGSLVVGARYADKGFIVVAAATADAARAMMERDPAMQAGVFVFELHPFAVFYPGTVHSRPRP